MQAEQKITTNINKNGVDNILRTLVYKQIVPEILTILIIMGVRYEKRL